MVISTELAALAGMLQPTAFLEQMAQLEGRQTVRTAAAAEVVALMIWAIFQEEWEAQQQPVV